MEIVEDTVFNPENIPRFHPETRYENCRFEGLEFSRHHITGITFVECHFAQCKLANQSLLNTSLRTVRFDECNLMGINWTTLKAMQDLHIHASKLDFGVFQECRLKDCHLTDCSALDADFAEADLTGADLSGTDFTGATFSNTRLSGADFRNSHGYVFDLRTTNIRNTQFSTQAIAPLLLALGAKIE